jgi:hypothetical protein
MAAIPMLFPDWNETGVLSSGSGSGCQDREIFAGLKEKLKRCWAAGRDIQAEGNLARVYFVRRDEPRW